MAHNIATINGSHAVFTGRNNPAWHKLGTTIQGVATWKDAMQLAGLDWQVEKRVLFDNAGNEVPAWGIFRNTDNVFLGVVGERYQTIQNEQAFEFVDALIGSNEAHYDSAGALGNGEVIFCSAYLPSAGFEVVEGDAHQTYLLFKTSHDGSLSAVCKLTDVRVVCQNTLTQALSIRGNDMKIKHTRNAQERMNMAKSLILSGRKTAELIREKMRMLTTKKVTREAMENILKRLFPTDENGALHTKTKNSIADLLGFYESNDNNAFPQVRGTAYNLLNACTEYADKARPTRGNSDVMAARAESALFGSGEKFKTDSLEVIMKEAATMPAMTQQTYRALTVPEAPKTSVDSLLDMVQL